MNSTQNTDLRDKIASALYLFTEQTDQGTPGWDELIANCGEDYETVVAYRKMADFVMPVLERALSESRDMTESSWHYQVHELQDQRRRFIDRTQKLAAQVDELERADATFKAMVRAARHSCDECPDRGGHEKRQGSRVLVEGSWFDRDDLPRILGATMRSLAEAERSLKEMAPATSVEIGCTCGGMALCEQRQEQDSFAKHVRVALQMGWEVGRAFGDPYQRRGPHNPTDNPFRAQGDA